MSLSNNLFSYSFAICIKPDPFNAAGHVVVKCEIFVGFGFGTSTIDVNLSNVTLFNLTCPTCCLICLSLSEDTALIADLSSDPYHRLLY